MGVLNTCLWPFTMGEKNGMNEKDRNVLGEVLDNSFVLIHMTGMHQSKTAFIRAVEDGIHGGCS